ncbi:MAG: SPFH domain-containing protein [Planctomycetota bacterium]|nr:SPFH domain-containing protein [Planctomycetota bacterium]
MGLFDKIRGEFIDIIEWLDDTRHTLVWRFPRYQNEIKNAAKLIVRPGQVAIFVSEGKLADVFEAGTYELTTANLPVLTTLKGWKYGFNSPFKAEVYFFSLRPVLDLKWGTPNPIMLRDAEFGPIRIRAFGSYVLKAADPKALLTEIVGTNAAVSTDEVTELIRSIIVESLTDLLGTSQIAALDLASNYRKLADELKKQVQERIDDEYGLELQQMMIVNISLPAEVEKALDLRTKMNMIGDMDRFQQYQLGESMVAAANSPAGGGAAEGMGLGMGLAMANRMTPLGVPGQAMAASVPPPAPVAVWHVANQGQTLGPFSLQQMLEAIGRAELQATGLVWTAGMADWQPAARVPALAGYFQAPPPPPPPAAPAPAAPKS